MEAFKSYLQVVINKKQLDDCIPEILESFQSKTLKKNEFLVEDNTICRYFCYIERGILQHSISVLGEEKTTYLALKNTCTSALKSFKNATPSRKKIKALTSCDLWILDLETFNRLLKTNEGFNRFYYNLIENQIYLIDDYRIDLLTLTPEERYNKLLGNDPEMLMQVPLHYLASFLGISTRHMSRIRKNIK